MRAERQDPHSEVLSADVYNRLVRLARRIRRGYPRTPATPGSISLLDTALARVLSTSSLPDDTGPLFGLLTQAMRFTLRDLFDRALAKKRTLDPSRSHDVPQPSAPPSPDSRLIMHELYQGLATALENLLEKDAKAATIIVMRYFGGLSWEQVAGEIGDTAASVRQRASTARAMLRREMSQLGIDEQVALDVIHRR